MRQCKDPVCFWESNYFVVDIYKVKPGMELDWRQLTKSLLFISYGLYRHIYIAARLRDKTKKKYTRRDLIRTVEHDESQQIKKCHEFPA